MNSTIPYGKNHVAGSTVDLDDASIYYEIYGEGEPLLLLHGNNQSISAFINQIGEFANHYKVIAADTRGHGNSRDESDGPLTYELFADDMKQLLDELNLQNVNILGWSDGGIAGLIMAMKYHGCVNKLAVMGANIFPAPDALKDVVFRDVNELIDDLKDKTDKQSVDQRRIYELVLNEPHLAFDDLKQINAPVLVMAGQNDVVTENHTRQIAENIPNSQLVIFKNASHFAPYYNAAEFNQAVLAFFAMQ
ncbi:MAG: alpha/beta hydrolase [Mucilaginibacter sp.]|nr:alpha/beta hydrolase [Mucilaginibacter sp.]